MLDRKGILKALDEFENSVGIYSDFLCLIAGAALVMHNIRLYTSDVDVEIDENEFERLLYELWIRDLPTVIWYVESVGDVRIAKITLASGTKFDVVSYPGSGPSEAFDWTGTVFCQTLEGALDMKLKLDQDKDHLSFLYVNIFEHIYLT